MPIAFTSQCVIVILLGLLFAVGGAAHGDQRYSFQEKIPLFLDNVVPEDNPSEGYRYLSLGYCSPAEMRWKTQDLGEVLQGSRKLYSSYEIRFGVDVPHMVLCQKTLQANDVAGFAKAILERYHYIMHIDEIPLRGYVGVTNSEGKAYLYTTLHFKLSYNKDRIIEAHVAPDADSKLLLPRSSSSVNVVFSYSVKWHETDIAFEDRSSNNAAELFKEEVEIQWFSIFNSLVIAVLLTGFMIYVVLRVLKKDYQNYAKLEEEDDEEDYGWKRLHADVFRFPPHKSLFCSILGCGVQIMLIFIFMLTLAVLGVFNPYGRGTTFASIIILYSLTAIIAGYVSGSMYKSMGGTAWVHNVLITVSLFIGPVFIIWAFLNSVAIAYGSTSALPFGTIVGLFALYCIITFPLTLAGAVTGKGFAGEFYAPTRTKFAPREIPPAPWHQGTSIQLIVAGALPFFSIYIELFYVFISIWGHQMFAPFGVLYLVLLILSMVVSSVTVLLTYFRLRSENHQWWWMSLFCGGSTSAFIYLYAFRFLFTESAMNGFLQLSFYFGYTAMLCYAVFLMLGAIGFFASLTFVREIYRTIKSD